jgi:hypothetical protein
MENVIKNKVQLFYCISALHKKDLKAFVLVRAHIHTHSSLKKILISKGKSYFRLVVINFLQVQEICFSPKNIQTISGAQPAVSPGIMWPWPNINLSPPSSSN